jgi:hypothetical protein
MIGCGSVTSKGGTGGGGEGGAGEGGAAGSNEGGTGGAAAGQTGSGSGGQAGGAGGIGGHAATGGTGGGAGGAISAGGSAGGGIAGVSGSGGQGGVATVLTHTLTVATPTGGTVTDAGQNINCGATCAHIYVDGTKVTLTATAGSGYQFTGWSGGGCSGVSTCTVTVSSDVTVTAVFTKLVTLTLDVVDDDGCQAAYSASGEASVNNMAECAIMNATQANPQKTCTYQFLAGTQLTVKAQTLNGSNFDGPPPLDCGQGVSTSGDCSTSSCSCVFTIAANTTVSAYFCQER